MALANRFRLSGAAIAAIWTLIWHDCSEGACSYPHPLPGQTLAAGCLDESEHDTERTDVNGRHAHGPHVLYLPSPERLQKRINRLSWSRYGRRSQAVLRK